MMGVDRRNLPEGYYITLVNGVLMVLKRGDYPSNVYAACRQEQGISLLMRRFWEIWKDYDRIVEVENMN